MHTDMTISLQAFSHLRKNLCSREWNILSTCHICQPSKEISVTLYCWLTSNTIQHNAILHHVAASNHWIFSSWATIWEAVTLINAEAMGRSVRYQRNSKQVICTLLMYMYIEITGSLCWFWNTDFFSVVHVHKPG